jgi:hypothetical protein
MDECTDRGKKYNACVSVQDGLAFLDPVKCTQNDFDPREYDTYLYMHTFMISFILVCYSNAKRLAEIYREIPLLTSGVTSKYGRNAVRLMGMVRYGGYGFFVSNYQFYTVRNIMEFHTKKCSWVEWN